MTSARSRLVVASLALLLVLAGVPGPAAADSRAGGTVIVAEDETVTGGLEAFGGSVVVRGTVDGDLAALGGDVRVIGEVTGDVSAVGGDVAISGRVGGDLNAVGGSVSVARGAEIVGDFTAATGAVALDGAVGGSASLGADDIALGPTASVAGDLRYDGSLTRAEGASVGGAVVREELGVGPVVLDRPFVGDRTFDPWGFAVNLLAGAALVAVFPRFSRGVAARIADSPLRTGGVGLLTLVAVPVALVLVAVTVVGIPLSFVGAILFGLAAWAGALYGRFAVGAWLAAAADVDDQWVALVAGFVAVALAVRIPFVGGLVDLAVFLLGLGALALSLRAAYRGSRPGTPEVDAVDESDVRPA